MRKLLVGMVVGSLLLSNTVQAAGLMDSVKEKTKSLASSVSSAGKDSATQQAEQKKFQTVINAQKTALKNAKALSKNAKWQLAQVLLNDVENEGEKSLYSTLKEEQISVNNNKDLSAEDKEKELNKIDDKVVDEIMKILNQKPKRVKSKDSEGNVVITETGGFLAVYENLSDSNKNKYKEAAKNLQIANNRFENIVNNLSPSFNKMLAGEFSASGAQIKETTSMAVTIKGSKMAQGRLLRKINITNEKLNIAITIPDNEKVVYQKDGIVGGINYQMDDATTDVKKAYKDLMDILDCQKSINAEIDKFKADNPEATGRELKAAYKKIANDAIRKASEEYAKADSEGKVKQLATQKKTKFVNATNTLIQAGAKYLNLAAECAGLGFAIYGNPVLAAPLALEADQLKYTAKFLKESAVSIKNVTPPLIKMAKAQKVGDQIKKPEIKTPFSNKTSNKASTASKLKSVNFKK